MERDIHIKTLGFRILKLEEILSGTRCRKEVAYDLRLSTRQLHRLLKKYKESGVMGIIHKNKGRVSKRKTPEPVRRKVLELINTKYKDFALREAHKCLCATEGLSLSYSTLRRICLAEQINHQKAS